MKSMMKMFGFLSLSTIILNVSCNKDNKPYKVETYAREITNAAFGNIDFDTTQTEIEEAGIEYGDTIDIKIDNVKEVGGDYSIGNGGTVEFKNIPFVTNYNEVGYYAPCICNYQKANQRFDIAFGLNRLKNHSAEMIKNRIKFTFTLNKKGGYNDMLKLISCPTKLSYEKVDRNNLVYANFRDVTSIGSIDEKIQTEKFYRGSSPFNAKKNNGDNDPRYLYADKLLGLNKITHEVSLSIDNKLNTKTNVYPISEMFKNNIVDSKSKTPNSEKIYGYTDEKTPGSNEDDRGEKTFISVGLGSDYFYDTDAHAGKTMTKKVFKFIADSSAGDNRIYIHCDEGKDRTGFFAMAIEALCGISYRDIVADFMCTFKNYFDFSRSTDDAKLKYDTMKYQTVCRHVYSICVEDPAVVNWSSINAEDELRKIGIAEDIDTSGDKLKEYAEKYIKRLFEVESEAKTIIDNIQNNIGKK